MKSHEVVSESCHTPFVTVPRRESDTLEPFDQLFNRCVRRAPERVAVSQDDKAWTYQDLSNAADRIASRLIAQDVRHGQRVGISMQRSCEAIAAMLGVHRAGAAFVPLDPEYPAERLEFMAEDAAIQVIIRDIAEAMVTEVNRDEIDQRRAALSGDDLAYVMYTSGSTGRPKGVQIDHSALTAYCLADAEVYQLSEEDRTLQFSTLNFDIAIEEIFPPLMTGGCVVVRPAQRSASQNELSDIIQRHSVTAIHLATAYWHEWVDLMVKTSQQVPDSLRLMVVTGEKVSVPHYHRFLSVASENVLWCNAYGPTEATVSATVFIPDGGFDSANMPIGVPLPRYTARILTNDGKEVGEGESGQLCIGGPGLARGYLNRPDLTEAAFMSWQGSDGPERLYKTGDVARWLTDGQIEFGGRIDHQIKLGSYRIEPAEIEAVLSDHENVIDSLVVCEEVDGKKFLLAYLVVSEDAVLDSTSTVTAVCDWLRGRLPDYMIPPRYITLSNFPTTINGKIDRKALRTSDHAVVPRSRSYVAPRNKLEKRLATLWAETLQLPEVGIHDDFFQLGGSSLLVTRIVAELAGGTEHDESFPDLPVRDFFANPTIAMLASHLQALRGGTPSTGSVKKDGEQRRSRLPVIHAGFFRRDQTDLYFVHYPPVENFADRTGHGIVICSSLGHEHTRGYRNLQQLAVMLAQAGHDVMRFDYTATGNSGGERCGFEFDAMQGDVRAACDYLRTITTVDQLSIIGLRLGGTVAANAQVEDLQRLVIWDPVVEGASFARQLDRFHHEALNGLDRYHRRRTGKSKYESFGYVLPLEQRSYLSRIKLPPRSQVFADETLAILSHGFVADEADPRGVLASWECSKTKDQIRWHDSKFTESAFSSPEAFDQVTQFLTVD